MFDIMDEMTNRRNKTIGQIALNWLMTSDPLVIPIPGAKNSAQATQNAGALGWSLPDEEFAAIAKWKARPIKLEEKQYFKNY